MKAKLISYKYFFQRAKQVQLVIQIYAIKYIVILYKIYL